MSYSNDEIGMMFKVTDLETGEVREGEVIEQDVTGGCHTYWIRFEGSCGLSGIPVNSDKYEIELI